VIVERLLAGVVFAEQPQDAVAVVDAPEGGEGVAEAEVDAADARAGGRGRAGDDAAGEIGIDQPLQGLERAAVLLAIVVRDAVAQPRMIGDGSSRPASADGHSMRINPTVRTYHPTGRSRRGIGKAGELTSPAGAIGQGAASVPHCGPPRAHAIAAVPLLRPRGREDASTGDPPAFLARIAHRGFVIRASRSS